MEREAFSHTFLRAMVASIAGLVLGCLAVVAVLVGRAVVEHGVSWTQVESTWVPTALSIVFALMYGWLPVLGFGGPVYAVLDWFGWANVLTVAVVGAIPAAVLWCFDSHWSGYFLLFGVPVALCTHAVARRILRRRPGAKAEGDTTEMSAPSARP